MYGSRTRPNICILNAFDIQKSKKKNETCNRLLLSIQLLIEVGYRGWFGGDHLELLPEHIRKLLWVPSNTKIPFFSKLREKPGCAAIFRPKLLNSYFMLKIEDISMGKRAFQML